jgi:hypothetical protein
MPTKAQLQKQYNKLTKQYIKAWQDEQKAFKHKNIVGAQLETLGRELREANEEKPSKPPNNFLRPGSDKAQKAGCTCPVMDNEYGKGYLGQDNIFVYSGGCPIHGTQKTT